VGDYDRAMKRIPILSCVIYLRDDGRVQEPPGRWDWFHGSPYMLFKYICSKLYELPREEITNLHKPSLLPLALLTKDKVNRIMALDTLAQLHENKLDDLLLVGQIIAGLVLGAVDLEWIKKEYYKMLDFFKDSPVYEWIADDALEEGFERGREQGRREALEAIQQQTVEEFRKTIVLLVAERFPKLERLAKRQVQTTDDIKLLQQAILLCSRTQDSTEVEIVLLDLDKE
jgi:predicted transposase YdaD